ncbi:type IV pilin-like G/H family protein [Nostoc sp. UHCC 0302]|uniref:type IV pilin-like G/H family protein n=1 Tax=Nostoc sp. UHCC 0302 TaxID=3134896 RepID=UPI00311CAB46
MKTELKAKFLQHILGKKKENEGFTLIELLVVIIIIGILSAIALPSFLNQANKAKQVEAKTTVGAMNRAQQAYYLENNSFAGKDDFGKLGLGVKTQTENYTYGIRDASTTMVTNYAQLKVDKSPLKVYLGGVGVSTVKATSEATTVALLCESDLPGNNADAKKADESFDATNIPADGTATKCHNGYTSLAK